jgi:hypothetical protein
VACSSRLYDPVHIKYRTKPQKNIKQTEKIIKPAEDGLRFNIRGSLSRIVKKPFPVMGMKSQPTKGMLYKNNRFNNPRKVKAPYHPTTVTYESIIAITK